MNPFEGKTNIEKYESNLHLVTKNGTDRSDILCIHVYKLDVFRKFLVCRNTAIGTA